MSLLDMCLGIPQPAHPLSRDKLALGHLEGRTCSRPPCPGSVISITCGIAHCHHPPHPQTTRPESQGHTAVFWVAHSSPLPTGSPGRPTCSSTRGWRHTSSLARLAGAFWGPELPFPHPGRGRHPATAGRAGGRPEVPCGAETLRPAATQRRRREGGAGRAGGRGRQEGAGAAAAIKPPRRPAG